MIIKKGMIKVSCMFFSHLQHLLHASTYIEFDGMVGKLSVSALRIENPLSIKKL